MPHRNMSTKQQIQTGTHPTWLQQSAEMMIAPSQKKNTHVELTWNPIANYGPARVHINKHAWDLLVLSRRCIEECMDLMGLHQKAAHKKTHKRYRSVVVDGDVVLQEVLIVEKRPAVTLEVTPRLEERPVADTAEGNVNDPPVRPPRRRLQG